MRKLVPLKSIYAFVAVAESGSMTEAAQLLSVSHSAISQAIKSLESQVNKPLFDRIGRHVYLNTEGKKYYRKVAPALEQIVDATEALMHDQNSQRITLNMVNSLALHWWIPRMPRFKPMRPNLMCAYLTFLDGSIWNKKALMLRWCMATLKNGKTTIAKSSVKTNWY